MQDPAEIDATVLKFIMAADCRGALLLRSVILFTVLFSAEGDEDVTVCPFVNRDLAVEPAWTDGIGVRSCPSCRWCPFRESSCCEQLDEGKLLTGIEISGANDWSCFVTVLAFQECGKCSPVASNLTVSVSNVSEISFGQRLLYAPDAGGHDQVIRVCRDECGYIYGRCRDTERLRSSYSGAEEACAAVSDHRLTVVETFNPADCSVIRYSRDDFCESDIAEVDEVKGVNCYSAASASTVAMAVSVAFLSVLSLSFLL